MTGEDVKSFREALGLSATEFGRAIGYGGDRDSIRRRVFRVEASPLVGPRDRARIAAVKFAVESIGAERYRQSVLALAQGDCAT